MNDQELRDLIASNAKAIKELSKITASNGKAIAAESDNISELRRDREEMYSIMRDLTGKQMVFYDILINLDKRQQELHDSQQKLIEITKNLALDKKSD